MVYRTFRRTSRRRGRRTLSNYSIATRTSSRSQAKQIYGLKKLVYKIQRRTKPEIVTIQRSTPPISTTNTTGQIGWITSGNSQVLWAQPNLGPVADQNSGAGDAVVPNNFARLQSFNLYGNLQYNEPSTTSVPETWRIVIVQTIQTRATNNSLGPTDIFTSGEPGSNSFNATFGPLQTGLSRTVKVLSDKRYTLTYQRPNITIRTRLRYLKPFYRDQASSSSGSNSSEAVPKGAIFVFFSRYTASTLTEAVSTMNFMYKLAYTDA